MSELLRPFKGLAEKARRYKNYITGNGEISEDIDSLLAPGKIEKLVEEFRTPVKIGMISTKEVGSGHKFETKAYYEIPPLGFDARDTLEIYESMGVHVFVNKLGIKRFGITFSLNKEQAKQVEERISAEKIRLGRKS